MSEPQPATDPSQPINRPGLFTPKPQQDGGAPVAAWGIAGVVIVLVLGILLFATRKKPAPPGNVAQPLAAYALNLPISQLAMSEAANISGGKYTYIDGHIKNTGTETISAVTVQVLFANDMALPPQVETLPLALIRTHEPYIDIQPVSAAPLKPGDDREFRLTFEVIPGNWNTQMPEVHVIAVDAK